MSGLLTCNCMDADWHYTSGCAERQRNEYAEHARLFQRVPRTSSLPPKQLVGISRTDERIVITVNDVYLAEATYDAVGSAGMYSIDTIVKRLCAQLGVELRRDD